MGTKLPGTLIAVLFTVSCDFSTKDTLPEMYGKSRWLSVVLWPVLLKWLFNAAGADPPLRLCCVCILTQQVGWLSWQRLKCTVYLFLCGIKFNQYKYSSELRAVESAWHCSCEDSETSTRTFKMHNFQWLTWHTVLFESSCSMPIAKTEIWQDCLLYCYS